MTPDWWNITDHVQRTEAIYRLKAGPYRHLHRVECECAGCCGKELAQEITRYNEDAQ